MLTLGLIPARKGSKGIPGKNLRPLLGKALIEHTFIQAKAAKALTRVLLSSDDQAMRALAQEHGVEAPFSRPPELAADEAPMLPVIRHALRWLEENQAWRPDAVVLLQPTSPLRRAEHIEQAVELLERSGTDMVVSVVEVPHNMVPESLMIERDGRLRLLTPGPSLLRRQEKPLYLARNGPAILAARADYLLKCVDLFEGSMAGYQMNKMDSIDIDDEQDFILAEMVLRHHRNIER